jgi:hypothetical protein
MTQIMNPRANRRVRADARAGQQPAEDIAEYPIDNGSSATRDEEGWTPGLGHGPVTHLGISPERGYRARGKRYLP